MKVIQEVRKELKKNSNLAFKKRGVRFFKEPIKVCGVRSNIVRKIAQKYFQEIKFNRLNSSKIKRSFNFTGAKEEFFILCEKMLKNDYHEEAIIVFIWTEKLVKNFDFSDFKTFETWIKKYVNNWGKCDVFCIHTINYFVRNYPLAIPKIKTWASSKNRWLRRAAAVGFIGSGSNNPKRNSSLRTRNKCGGAATLPTNLPRCPAAGGDKFISGSKDFPKKKHLPHIFWIAKKLLKDPDDLVQKGCGWMLKRAAENFEKEVFNFVMKNKKQMPRTALRYAIEKMPISLKKKAMQ